MSDYTTYKDSAWVRFPCASAIKALISFKRTPLLHLEKRQTKGKQ